MKTARAPADPAKLVKNFLAGKIASSVATVGLGLPPEWTPDSLPAVVVFDDGGLQSWPVATAPQVRVTAWAAGRTGARDLAGRCLGWLLSEHVPGVTSIRPGSTLIDDRDPDNNGHMASFTVTATARTIPL